MDRKIQMKDAVSSLEKIPDEADYMFEYSLVAGLTASGADVFLLHVTTTPSVSYVVTHRRL